MSTGLYNKYKAYYQYLPEIYMCLVVQTKNMKILLGDIINKKNLTRRQVAILTGVPRSTISDIISGRTSPRMDTMEQLAKGLKVRISDLYESDFK